MQRYGLLAVFIYNMYVSQVLSRRILNKKNIHLQFLHFLGPFCMQNKNLYPKNLWLHVLWRAGLTRAGQSSHSAQMGWIGRPWIARPSKGHEATDFWGKYSCSTCKKVPKNAKFVDVYCFCLTFVYSGTVVCVYTCLPCQKMADFCQYVVPDIVIIIWPFIVE